MNQGLYSVGSTLLTECRLRLRRGSTWILFVLLCLAAFLLMPDVSGGGVSFLIAGRRVLLNSAATALTSALLGGVLLSLIGFYVISNSIGRDAQTGVGQLLASSPLSSAQYLAGKLLGNMVYLYAICCFFMIACMSVHLIRGEAPLEPLVFIETFGIMFLPMVPFISAVALLFESVPFLSGRFGDILYFFLWTTLLGLSAASLEGSGNPSWLLGFDITGMGFFLSEILHVTGTSHFSIGYTPYDATLTPTLFQGLQWDWELIAPRLVSVVIALPCFLIALATFRRFDPAAGRRGKAGVGIISRLRQRLAFSWLHRYIPRIGFFAGSPTLIRMTILDLQLTLALSPFLLLMMIGVFVTGILVPIDAVRSILAPVVFLLCIPALAGISTRDRIENTTSLTFSAPRMRNQYAIVKFLSSFTVMLLLALIPLIRIAVDDPFGGTALLVGMLFASSVATCLGLVTGSPKPFTVLFLLFLYLAFSSRTESAFDFAGWGRIATPGTVASYATVAFFMVLAAWVGERLRRGRE